jgi:hypothetical protein
LSHLTILHNNSLYFLRPRHQLKKGKNDEQNIFKILNTKQHTPGQNVQVNDKVTLEDTRIELRSS